MLVGRNRVLGRQCAYPLQRLETDRAHHNQLVGDRIEQQLCLTDQRRQLGFYPGGRHQLFEGFQPGAALATECDSVGLTSHEAIDQSVGGMRAVPAAISGHPVVLVDRHGLCLLCASVRVSSYSGPGCRAGHPRLRTDSQPKSSDRCVVGGPARGSSSATGCIGLIRVS